MTSFPSAGRTQKNVWRSYLHADTLQEGIIYIADGHQGFFTGCLVKTVMRLRLWEHFSALHFAESKKMVRPQKFLWQQEVNQHSWMILSQKAVESQSSESLKKPPGSV